MANRKLARAGGNPVAEKRRSHGVPTFVEAAVRVIGQKRCGWRSPKTPRLWIRTLEMYAFPRLGKVPVSEITSADVLETLSPIWHTRPKVARAVRLRIRAVLEWAVAMDWRGDNPCDRLLPVLGPQHDVVTQGLEGQLPDEIPASYREHYGLTRLRDRPGEPGGSSEEAAAAREVVNQVRERFFPRFGIQV